MPEEKQKGKVGRPRTKPTKERSDWHYHLGGVRHSRSNCACSFCVAKTQILTC